MASVWTAAPRSSMSDADDDRGNIVTHGQQRFSACYEVVRESTVSVVGHGELGSKTQASDSDNYTRQARCEVTPKPSA